MSPWSITRQFGEAMANLPSITIGFMIRKGAGVVGPVVGHEDGADGAHIMTAWYIMSSTFSVSRDEV